MQNPELILSPYVASGMTILEVGPAMGFFSLPLARMVGPNGKVVCVDVQKKMVESLQRRALKAGLADRIIARVCDSKSLGVGDADRGFDFVLAFAVVHEVPDESRLFAEIVRALKPKAKCLVAEPRLHVSARKFERIMTTAAQQGLRVMERPRIAGSRAALMIAP
jgi:ubiquinone/menaquinone biosynthesis C-methylase UbiE